MENRSEMTLDKRLQEVLDDTLRRHRLNSLLLADRRGLTVCHAGNIAHAGMAAIGPELIKIGDHAVRLGEYGSITCVSLLLEDSHLMIFKEIDINGEPFVLVMDTSVVPNGLRGILEILRKRIIEAMNWEQQHSQYV